MDTNILATAAALSDQELPSRLDALAGKERETSVELVAHLAALDIRPAVYAAQGFGSLFSYCTQTLRLSEDAACNRIAAAHACRAFPVIRDQTCPTSVRRLPTPTVAPILTQCSPAPTVSTATSVPSETAPAIAPSPAVFVPTPRPIVQATAPERYRVQFTIGEETHEKLRRVQSLLRREIPSGDPAAIFDRALTLLLEKVEKTKIAATSKLRPLRSIRSGTGKSTSPLAPHATARERSNAPSGGATAGSAHSWRPPDGGARSARSWTTTTSSPTRNKARPPSRTSLFDRRHNQYEAELVFGPFSPSIVREARSPVLLRTGHNNRLAIRAVERRW